MLRSVPGVGPVLTTTLLANLLELGTLTSKEVAALSWHRAVSTRQQDAQGATNHLGRPCPCAGRTLHGNSGGDTEESRDSALVSGGEGEVVGVDGLHAKAPHDSQCDGEAWHAMARHGWPA